MGFRFFHRLHIAPGLTVNLSRSGPSLSLGVRGAHLTVGATGVTKTVGLPGTGAFYTSKKGWHSGVHTNQNLSPAVQAVSGGQEPDWKDKVGTETADGLMIWKNHGGFDPSVILENEDQKRSVYPGALTPATEQETTDRANRLNELRGQRKADVDRILENEAPRAGLTVDETRAMGMPQDPNDRSDRWSG